MLSKIIRQILGKEISLEALADLEESELNSLKGKSITKEDLRVVITNSYTCEINGEPYYFYDYELYQKEKI